LKVFDVQFEVRLRSQDRWEYTAVKSAGL
jgi:hypothetical protein